MATNWPSLCAHQVLSVRACMATHWPSLHACWMLSIRGLYVLDSGTPGKPEAESDKASGSAGGCIARSAIAGRPIALGAGCAPAHLGAHT